MADNADLGWMTIVFPGAFVELLERDAMVLAKRLRRRAEPADEYPSSLAVARRIEPLDEADGRLFLSALSPESFSTRWTRGV